MTLYDYLIAIQAVARMDQVPERAEASMEELIEFRKDVPVRCGEYGCAAEHHHIPQDVRGYQGVFFGVALYEFDTGIPGLRIKCKGTV